MPKIKTDTLTFRVEPRVKRALQIAAERERRSLANMIEVMVLEYCEKRGFFHETRSKPLATRGKQTDGPLPEF
jgi:hypothetical protein